MKNLKKITNTYTIYMMLVYYDIAAVFILTLNLYLFYSRSRLFIARTRSFALLLWVSLSVTLIDVLGVIAYWEVHRIPLPTIYAINVVFFILQSTIAPVFALFVLSISGRYRRIGLPGRISFFLPSAAAVVLSITTPWTGLVFRFGPSLEYIRGPAQSALYGNAALYLVIGLTCLYLDRKRISRDIRLAVFLFLPFVTIPIGIQFFFPELLLQNFGVAVSELFILLTIQDFGRYLDRTTGLFNRSGLVMQFESLTRSRKTVSVFLVVLETAGFLLHVLGPEIFVALERDIAEKLFGPIRPDRFAARTGAGSFVLIVARGERLDVERRSLLGYFSTPRVMGNHLLSISARICEIPVPDEMTDIRRITQAQQKLAGANESLPSNTILSLQDLELSTASRRHDVAEAVRKALNSSSFQVYYQPIVSAETGRIVSAEALVRLHSETLGWISPVEFIQLAEQNGTIHRIGDFVLEESCRFLARLRETGHRLENLEINLSAAQCIQANLVGRLTSTAQRYGLSPEELCFEITETAAALSPKLMRRNLEALAAAGFSLAIDDFGTGYSNVAGLMEIPFRIVKIDRSIVLGMEQSPNIRIGVEGLITMFRSMGVRIVAEGIETQAQLDTLRSLGAELIQGFYFSCPLPEHEFVRFLEEREVVCT
jgi:EAL domain-containing protein (putative c-di-GMP-specific phosphodiesterase class I)